ncbi:MAG: acyl carrier protein [Bacillota bacterium]|nr:acyl carrier protein [Bacillota bacterium]
MFEKVCKVLVENIGLEPEDITMEASLKEDLEIDSLDAVELNMALEDEFNVSIDDEVLASMKTVGDIVKHLEANC